MPFSPAGGTARSLREEARLRPRAIPLFTQRVNHDHAVGGVLSGAPRQVPRCACPQTDVGGPGSERQAGAFPICGTNLVTSERGC